jgi:hypothetical protein
MKIISILFYFSCHFCWKRTFFVVFSGRGGITSDDAVVFVVQAVFLFSLASSADDLWW